MGFICPKKEVFWQKNVLFQKLLLYQKCKIFKLLRSNLEFYHRLCLSRISMVHEHNKIPKAYLVWNCKYLDISDKDFPSTLIGRKSAIVELLNKVLFPIFLRERRTMVYHWARDRPENINIKSWRRQQMQKYLEHHPDSKPKDVLD